MENKMIKKELKKMENKMIKKELKKLRDAFESDYAILILSKDGFDKVFTSAGNDKQEFAEMGEILTSCANLMKSCENLMKYKASEKDE